MKWLPDNEIYRDTCVRLSKNMAHFKQDLNYKKYVGVDARGSSYVNAFNQAVRSAYVSKNDIIGNPVLHLGKSAGTLRYMYVVECCIDKFGKFDTVAEIGGGYGGQCLVMKEMLPDIEYTIIDIPEALQLSKKYLDYNAIDCNFLMPEYVDLNIDLLIADFSLSEFDNELVKYYLDNVSSKYLHCACNLKDIGWFLDLLTNYYNLEIIEENPRTSPRTDNKTIYGVAHNNL